MRGNNITVFAFGAVVALSCPICPRAKVEQAPYPNMASFVQYLISGEKAEIALARSTAPASISGEAEVKVLRRDGYATAVTGSNGFVCIVERSWAKASNESDFWNPKIRAPICFNPSAARTFLPIFLMKTKTGAHRKIEAGNHRGDRFGTGQETITCARAGSDVLHDVEAAVFRRPRQGLVSPSHVFCFRRCCKKLGSGRGGLAADCGE